MRVRLGPGGVAAIRPTLSLALIGGLMAGPAQGTSDADPLNLLAGRYAGTLSWSPDRFSSPTMMMPVMRWEETDFSLALVRTKEGARLTWTFDGETVEAWIVGQVGGRSYAAPAELGVLCHPLDLRRKGANIPDLWFACEPARAPGTSPAVLIALTAGNKSANGRAATLLLHFKQYERRDRTLWRDATANLRREGE